MQGTIVMPDEHLQSSTPPPNKSNDPQNNMDISPKSTLATKDFNVNQSNQSDSGILSATGTSTYTDMDVSNRSENEETDNRSSCSSPDRKFLCSICETILTSQHEFTLHIRSHNNESEAQDNEKGFVCRICFKILSSAASLDRHVLIHSGERPFPCKYCGDTFTTNGNMHRHMRTHTNKTNYESDGSSDSGASCSSKTVEYNNNKVIPKIDINTSYDMSKKRNCSSIDENKNNKRIKLQETSYDSSQTYACPVCRRDDFTSTDILEIHLEDNHPDFPAKCSICNKSFKNLKVLREHKFNVHTKNGSKHHKNSVLGFQDLTFVDFSSQKFPYIAKYECEKNLHKPASAPKFQCNKCSRAFPCSMSLEIHVPDCTASLDLSTKTKLYSSDDKESEKDVYRNDFFARLDLQSKLQKSEDGRDEQVLKYNTNIPPPSDTKDLADIQSIISITTNGSLLHQLQTNPNELNSIKQESELDTSRNENDEESQDIFATEFRKMKIRGEFPCRLCRAVFPNLRALKGHNRSHLNGNNNGMYLCNMCPHSSLDKAALIRHMRTHNGDRPYECSLCKYAFTTKANCERHLKNRHAKNTREEVKKAIIYHPSEDPSNEEISKMLSHEETNKALLLSNTHKSVNKPTDKVKIMTPNITSLLGTSPTKNSVSSENINSFNIEANISRCYSGNEIPHKDNMNVPQIVAPYSPQYNFYPKLENTSTPQKNLPKINVKNIESLITPEQEANEDLNNSDCDSVECDDQPMDLVLDLSKKKSEPIRTHQEIRAVSPVMDHPQDLSKRSTEIPLPVQNEILTQNLLKNTAKLDPAALYASQLALYRNGFPPLHSLHTWPFSLNPLLFQSISNPLLTQDPQEMKERLQRLQLCGGGMIMDSFAERFKNYHPTMNNANLNPFNNYKVNEVQQAMHDSNYLHRATKPDDGTPLSLSVEQNMAESMASMHSPGQIPKVESISSSAAVKMIIKNGVLMPKQKQRRYRTERPFSCEYCSAKFTLRSNMERHIKQQHPQFWQQRHKASMGAGRKPQSSSTIQKQNFCNINIPNYDTPRKQEYDEPKDNQISDKIKYAILAQQLKDSHDYKITNKGDIKIKEEDEEVPLIIDEPHENANKIDEGVDRRINDHFSDKSKQYADMHASNTLSFNSIKSEETQDLVPVARLLDNASQQPFKKYFHREADGREGGVSEEDEEGLVASGSTSEENNSGTDENRSESENTVLPTPVKKKSAYSLAPNRVTCPYCKRKFPWTSSLRRHILTHTGQKPYKCSHCSLLFTTKSNCDRHLLRKHGNAASVINTNDHSTGSTNFMMRNVPDRPYKCPTCPSSTFATNSNLRKHISTKHSLQGAPSDDAQVSPGYEAGSSEDEKVSQGERKSEWDKQLLPNSKALPYSNPDSQNIHLQNSDLPFKCHLCDNSFGERHDALDHIKDKHNSEYELLLSKNALDVNATTPDENPHHDENEESEVRGKFPDYANRKVICAFCMRRFWSAEDLRRHMRTHTGERPFSCDVCHRRFTLKHSMLRHRKKHNLQSENDQINSDEDNNCVNLSSSYKTNNNNMERKASDKTDESDGTESDLISNLLGIRDRSIIEQVLTSSADDAAKLLGVKSGESE